MYNPDEEYQLVLNKLKMICEQKNMSKYALAKETGMSTSSMSNLLNGKTKPYVYTLLSICSVLKIPVGDLFGKENCDYENEKWIICAYQSMSSKKKEMLEVYVDMLLQYNDEG